MDKDKYSPNEIEARYQKIWEDNGLFSPDLKGVQKPYYNLMMFPYPSAEGLHVGNMYAFAGSDIWGRFMRMKGFDVFEPIGLDGFGIHSENYAIKIREHPAELSKKTQERFYKQLHATGNAYAWRHTLETYDPDYYRWTQWIFVQMFKHGLAYRAKSEVNWCPSCKTVLADEQVVKSVRPSVGFSVDVCERCQAPVERRKLEQWFFKITDYADRLLSNLKKIDWVEKVKTAQRNWIGRKEGVEITYRVVGSVSVSISVFTTRPDTNFGATFIVLAPEHPIVASLLKSKLEEVREYVERVKSMTKEDRIVEGKKKTGVFTGTYAINDLNGERMPVWVSDFVLMEFGTGAVVGVPGHDKRDFEFAQEFGIPIKRVVVGTDGDNSEITRIEQVQEEEGTMVNSGFLDGLGIKEAIDKMMDHLEEKGWGKRVTTYHLRDWLISRQRYWGPPIPMVFCEGCRVKGKGERDDMPGWYTVPEDQLPVVLPYVENFKPTGTGKAPLAQDRDFVNTTCPGCGGTARREIDVSDTFLDSAWYFLRYPSVGTEEQKNRGTKGQKLPWGPEITKRWLPVHMYIGGAEHSVLHLMYSRFITMALHDWGYIDFEEPFTRFYAHGLLIKDGAKMSKSKGNVVVPDDYIKKYGADTLRTYLMFLGPFDQGGDFRDTGIEGMHRFLKRVWRLVSEFSVFPLRREASNFQFSTEGESRRMYGVIHKTIKRVTEDMERLRYNRAIAGIMEYVNFLIANRENPRRKPGDESMSEHTGETPPLRRRGRFGMKLEDTTGVSQWSFMEFVKRKAESEKGKELRPKIQCAEWEEAIRVLLLLLAPFAPYLTEELYQHLGVGNPKYEARNTKQSGRWKMEDGKFESIHFQPWPKYSPELVEDEEVRIPVQVDGKLRDTIEMQKAKSEKQSDVERAARGSEKVAKYLEGKKVKKVIFVPARLLNFVTS